MHGTGYTNPVQVMVLLMSHGILLYGTGYTNPVQVMVLLMSPGPFHVVGLASNRIHNLLHYMLVIYPLS